MLTFSSVYERVEGSARIQGWALSDDDACRAFFRDEVAERVRESDGTEILRSFLADIPGTGFDAAAIQSQVEESPPLKDWEIGEICAQLLLEAKYGASFPWPTGLDRRIAKASLPGPDLAGFRLAEPLFAMGEVKSSSEDLSPPQVVTKASGGLATQLRELVTQPIRRQTLIEWLVVRSKETSWSDALAAASAAYYSSPSRAWIVGVLMRGNTEPNEADLSRITARLGTTEYEVSLVAFYVPLAKSEWPALLLSSGAVE